MLEKTLSIIKPDAVRAKKAGDIISLFEKNNFNIIVQKKITLTKKQAEKFYDVHQDKKFYNELVQFMISGPIIIQVLEKENAILENRKLMGSTNPKEASIGTIRNIYGKNIEENAVHGSDSPETAQKEISFFFSHMELV